MAYGTEMATNFEKGMLHLPQQAMSIETTPWVPHSAFEGVELKHLIRSLQTDGAFSFHLVRIAPHKKIGRHIHENQLETHEVVSGQGFCTYGNIGLEYAPGTVVLFPQGLPHEICAGEEGLFLFAKFFPALC